MIIIASNERYNIDNYCLQRITAMEWWDPGSLPLYVVGNGSADEASKRLQSEAPSNI